MFQFAVVGCDTESIEPEWPPYRRQGAVADPRLRGSGGWGRQKRAVARRAGGKRKAGTRCRSQDRGVVNGAAPQAGPHRPDRVLLDARKGTRSPFEQRIKSSRRNGV